MKTPRFFAKALIFPPLLMVPSCQDGAAKMGKGFRLPDGKIEQGQTAFVAMKCNQCHSVAGLDLAKPEAPSPIQFELGGEVRKVKSYGELVTSIIQPQHIVSPEYLAKAGKDPRGAVSPMPSYNDTMTVTQLTDIVTFLHSRYQVSPPSGVSYPTYMP